jgi:hypothetical protein
MSYEELLRAFGAYDLLLVVFYQHIEQIRGRIELYFSPLSAHTFLLKGVDNCGFISFPREFVHLLSFLQLE